MSDGRETWRNETRGRVGVVRFDRRGELTHELIRGGGTVYLTPDERALNQDRAATEQLDVFKNGTMVPVKLLDSSENAAEILANPNLKSEQDLRDLFKLQWKKFEVEVGKISNETTLNRLKDIAREGDATIKQVSVIEARLAEVNPSVAVDVTVQSYSGVPH
jgi:hypothetical protein